MAHICILGAGGFGTALAVMTQGAGHTVTLWSYQEAEAAALGQERENTRLLPGIRIPEEILITSDREAVSQADFVILATPSSAVREVCRWAVPLLKPGAILVCVSKGLEPGTLLRMSQVISEEAPGIPWAILSGPSHAEEIAKGIPTTVVAASVDRRAAETVQEALSNPAFRIYVNDDVVGVELGGALKNVIALAAGALDGLGQGDNTRAALMTRGLTEIARLGIACGGKSETFAGLSGMGDLIVTCTSMHSRNRRCGILIGSGVPPKEALAQIGMTVEGYTSTKAAYEMSQRMGVEMPITREIYKVLYEGKSPKEAIRDLMDRPKRHESEVIWLLTR